MKLLIVSDTHGDRNFLRELTQIHYDADYYLHLGDSELSPEEISPFASVKGNMDYYHYPYERILTIKNKSILLVHGNDISKISEEYMKENNVDIILFGHQHIAKIIKLENNRYIINPGSYTRPRDGSNGTYCIIKIDDDINVEILERK